MNAIEMTPDDDIPSALPESLGQALPAVLDAMPVPLSIATLPGGAIQFCNAAFRQTFGYRARDLNDVDNFIQIAYPDPTERTRARQQWAQLWQPHATGVTHIPEVELTMRGLDGVQRIVLHRGVMLHDLGIAIATFDDISTRKAAEQLTWRFANEDFLTGLPNRRQLMAYWHALTDAGTTHLSLLLLDLDRFKQVNDQYGHDMGDAVLREVAVRLRTTTREDDLVCRFGGDEFGVLLPGTKSPADIDDICTRILATVSRPIQALGNEVQVGTSIGVSRMPQDGAHFVALFKAADEALYRCKQEQRGSWRWASPPHDEPTRPAPYAPVQ